MYSHPIHFKHELGLCIQITRGRVNFNGNSAEKSPCWHRVSNLRPSRPMLLNFSVQMGPSVLKIKMEILVVQLFPFKIIIKLYHLIPNEESLEWYVHGLNFSYDLIALSKCTFTFSWPFNICVPNLSSDQSCWISLSQDLISVLKWCVPKSPANHHKMSVPGCLQVLTRITLSGNRQALLL